MNAPRMTENISQGLGNCLNFKKVSIFGKFDHNVFKIKIYVCFIKSYNFRDNSIVHVVYLLFFPNYQRNTM